LCEIGKHELSRHFPYSESWAFCCDCQTFYADALTKKICPNCSRKPSRSYLCHKCLTLSTESDEAVLDKPYSLHKNKIEPFCPGCRTVADKKILYEHKCKYEIDFFTFWQVCPFCDNGLVEIYFPISPLEYINYLKGEKVAYNEKSKLLTQEVKEKWQPLIIAREGDRSIALPTIPIFSSHIFEIFYKNIYSCFSSDRKGKILVVKPAVVESTNGGWRLLDKGEIKVEGNFKEEQATTENPEESIQEKIDPPIDKKDTANNPEQNLKEESNQENSFVSCLGCIFLIGIVIVFFIIVGWLASLKEIKSNNNNFHSPTPVTAN
jgi:hypothetical protein